MPFIGPSGEQKTKPTQHSVTELRSRGIQPDAIVCRATGHLDRAQGEDLRAVRRARRGHRVNAVDADNLYEIPLVLHEEGLDEVRVPDAAASPSTTPDLSEWERSSTGSRPPTAPVRIGIVGKYVNLPDAYLSVVEALRHGGFATAPRSRSTGSHAEDAEGLLAEGRLRDLDGIVIPGGFGVRGIEGKIAAAGYAREHGDPVPRACASACSA